MYFHLDYIASKISLTFFVLSRSQVIESKISIISKFMRKYNPLKPKIGNNLIEAKLVLFTSNSAISNLSDQLSC